MNMGKRLLAALMMLALLAMCGLTALAEAVTEEAAEEVKPVYDLTNGESYAIDELFIDADAAIKMMESIAVADMEENGNAYLEHREVTPLPLDRWEIDAYGITVRYPTEMLSTFAGRPGAYHFYWYELAGLFNEELVDAIRVRANENEAATTTVTAEGMERVTLPCLPMIALGDDLERLAMIYGGGKESDFTMDGQAYRFEDGRLRGVTVLTNRDDPTGTGQVLEIRASRLALEDGFSGAVGKLSGDSFFSWMGFQESEREIIGEDAAYDRLLPVGEIYWYNQEGARLGLMVDERDILTCVILSMAE